MININAEQAYSSILKDVKNFSLLPEVFKSDQEFIKKCLKIPNFSIQLKHISDKLKSDADFAKELIEINPLSLMSFAHSIQSSKEHVLLAVEKDDFIFQFLGDDLKPYQGQLDKLRSDIKIEKLKEKLDLGLIYSVTKSRIKKI